MKVLKTIAIALALTAGAAVAEAAGDQPVKWLEERHNFGAFDEDDGQVSCEFRFVNTSGEPVSITSARASCGCTVPSYPRRAIAPGDTATIKVTYDPTGRPGRFEKNVKVKLSDGRSEQVTLRIAGVVIGNANSLRSRYPIAAGPLRLRTEILPFGPVGDIRAKSEFFEVYNASTDSVTPRWIDLPDYISATTITPTVPPGEQIAYAVTIFPAKLKTYGLINDSIKFVPADGADPVTIEILANIKEDFSRLTPGQRKNAPVVALSAETIDLGSVDDKSKEISCTFEVANRGKSTMEIRRVYTLDKGVEVAVDRTKLKKGKSATVTVTINPTELPSEIINARIAVITNDPENPEAIVRIVGY